MKPVHQKMLFAVIVVLLMAATFYQTSGYPTFKNPDNK